MPGRLRRLSGAEVVSILEGFGFQRVGQAGDHLKLRRLTDAGARETLVVPLHRELDLGTVRAIFRQASRYVSEADMRKLFYVD
jgi:predicted RNA binding protein YcfA (HicA-like mRNA interferase family)